jgi:hypothetical protein
MIQIPHLNLVGFLQDNYIRWKWTITTHLRQIPPMLQGKVLQLLLDMLCNKINCHSIFQASWYNLGTTN